MALDKPGVFLNWNWQLLIILAVVLNLELEQVVVSGASSSLRSECPLFPVKDDEKPSVKTCPCQPPESEPLLHPRVFPLCATPKNFDRESVWSLNLISTIDAIYKDFRGPGGQRFYQFNPEKDLWKENDEWIQSIEFTPVVSCTPDVYRLSVKFPKSQVFGLTRSILIDHVVGPIGVPSAAFDKSHTCDNNDVTLEPKPINILGSPIVKCDFKSHVPRKDSESNFYFADLKIDEDEVWVYFKKNSIFACSEVGQIQFIIIFVRHFATGTDMVRDEHYRMLLSPVWGISPRTSAELEQPKILTSIPRIVANHAWESCMMSRMGDGKDPIVSPSTARVCPPGPFNCTGSSNAILKNWENRVDNFYRKECSETHTATTTTTPSNNGSILVPEKSLEEQLLEMLKLNDLWETIYLKKRHGTFAHLVFLLLVPIANALARHFKETPSQFWIIAHIVIHTLVYILMWAMLGEVIVFGDPAEDEEVFHPDVEMDDVEAENSDAGDMGKRTEMFLLHITIGWIVVIVHHIQIVLGFLRSKSDGWRKCESWVHTILGYASYILSIAAASAATAICPNDVIVSVSLLVGFYVLGAVILWCLDFQLDESLEIRPRRRRFPFLEPIKLEKSSPVYLQMKYCVLFIMITLMVIAWITECAADSTFYSSAKKFIEENWGEISRVQNVSSFMGECTGMPKYA